MSLIRNARPVEGRITGSDEGVYFSRRQWLAVDAYSQFVMLEPGVAMVNATEGGIELGIAEQASHYKVSYTQHLEREGDPEAAASFADDAVAYQVAAAAEPTWGALDLFKWSHIGGTPVTFTHSEVTEALEVYTAWKGEAIDFEFILEAVGGEVTLTPDEVETAWAKFIGLCELAAVLGEGITFHPIEII